MSGIYDLLLLFFELSAIILDYLLGAVLVIKTFKMGANPARKYYLGVLGFFFAHGTCRFLFFLRKYSFPGNDLLNEIGSILGLSSVVLLVAAIESTVYTKSKKFFTFYGCAALIIMIIDIFTQLTFFNLRLYILVSYFTEPVLALFIASIYLIACIKSTGKIRNNALFMLIAIVLLAVSELSNSIIANKLIPGVEFIGAVMMVIALILLYFSVMNLSVWKRENAQEKTKRKETPKQDSPVE